MRWVVVGAGAAGSIVAGRLASHGGLDVTLVEAGPLAAPTVSDALIAIATPGRTWAGVRARTASGSRPYVLGRGSGGSAGVNAMVASLPPAEQLARWGLDTTGLGALGVPFAPATDDELGPLDTAMRAGDHRAFAVDLTRRGGERVTSFDVHVTPAVESGTLRVVGSGTVSRILTERARVTGLALDDGRLIEADRVVLCAGAVGTPWLLRRSGLLDRGTVPVCDHPAVSLTLRLRSSEDRAATSLLVSTGIDLGEVEVLGLNHLGTGAPGHAGLVLTHLRPDAVGTLHLDGPSPELELDLLDTPARREVLLSALDEVMQLVHNPAMTSLVDDVLVDSFGTRFDALDGEEAIAEWISTSASTGYHAGATLPLDGPAASWTPWLERCRGLAVIDASRFPELPMANPMMATMLLADRLAGLLA